ncbi:MAG: ABC transporter ATP-binding protein, partial [Rhodobacteraceae bacterium]|nr:ABC transporter ATP-binding protein [Paracoccaceae bacterium]
MIPAAALVARLIDPFRPANGPPPGRLWPFARWALDGAGRAIGLAFAISVVAGVTEMAAAWMIGWVLDSAVATGPAPFWATFWPLILAGAAFFLVLRPLVFSADAAGTSIILGPHLFPLVLNRINRHTMGHALRFFENDFAGRISQKQMQTARALTDVVIEVSDVVIYGGAVFIGALVLMAGVDARLLAGFAVWGALYALALRWFIPRVQARSASRAGARTAVTGQIVDALTNIATVKLFAHDDVEDRATMAALDRFRARALDFGLISAGFRLVLTTLGGILPVVAIFGSLWLWTLGQATAGDIAMTAMVATRLGQITNRLGRAAVAIFANIGEIEDGIATLTPPHEIVDRPGALPEARGPGAVRFRAVRFAYGGRIAALDGFDLSIAAGE